MIDIYTLFTTVSKSLVILLAGFLISKISSMSLLRIFKEFNVDENINKIFKLDIGYSELFAKFLEILIVIIAFFYSIRELQILPFISLILFIIIFIVVFVLFTISIGNYIANFISGLSFRKTLTSNKIQIDLEKYTIINKNFFFIETLDSQGFKHIIPYSYLNSHKFKILKSKKNNLPQ